MKHLAHLLGILSVIMMINTQCRKPEKEDTGGCAVEAVVPNPTYTNPAWHPNGKILAFNYVLLQYSIPYGTPPCISYDFLYVNDSSGFWLCNSDGSNMRRT